jgi:hypothetical protein
MLIFHNLRCFLYLKQHKTPAESVTLKSRHSILDFTVLLQPPASISRQKYGGAEKSFPSIPVGMKHETKEAHSPQQQHFTTAFNSSSGTI